MMEISNSHHDHTGSTSTAEMEIEKAPTTFLSLPAELRNEIYKLSGCLGARQWNKVICREACRHSDNPGHQDFGCCAVCFVCMSDGSRCRLCLHLAVSKGIGDKTASLWVNRNIDCAPKGRRSKQTMHNPTPTMITPFPRILGDNIKSSAHAAHIEHGVQQPAIAKVSKQVRKEALSIFYGNHSFLFTLFDREADAATIFKWVRTIGRDNAALLGKVKIVVRGKNDMKYAETELKRALKKQGLNANGAMEVEVVKLSFPFCYCEGCVREALGEI